MLFIRLFTLEEREEKDNRITQSYKIKSKGFKNLVSNGLKKDKIF